MATKKKKKVDQGTRIFARHHLPCKLCDCRLPSVRPREYQRAGEKIVIETCHDCNLRAIKDLFNDFVRMASEKQLHAIDPSSDGFHLGSWEPGA